MPAPPAGPVFHYLSGRLGWRARVKGQPDLGAALGRVLQGITICGSPEHARPGAGEGDWSRPRRRAGGTAPLFPAESPPRRLGSYWLRGPRRGSLCPAVSWAGGGKEPEVGGEIGPGGMRSPSFGLRVAGA